MKDLFFNCSLKLTTAIFPLRRRQEDMIQVYKKLTHPEIRSFPTARSSLQRRTQAQVACLTLQSRTQGLPLSEASLRDGTC